MRVVIHHYLLSLLGFMAIGASVARGETQPVRPNLSGAPIATCKVQLVTVRQEPKYAQGVIGIYSLPPPADDPLANYERTPLGDWPMPAQADRHDPWLRILLLAPKRPVVIDVAVLIDGRSFRDSREAWIDGVIADANSQAHVHSADSQSLQSAGNNNSASPGTNSADETSVVDVGRATPADEKPSRLAGPDVAIQTRQAATMRERLISYLNISDAAADRDEIGWLLAEWGAGPGVVVLSTGLSWQRAGVAPLLNYLDQNADGEISASEMDQINAFMVRADYNGDDVVDVDELRRGAANLSVAKANGHPLVVRLDANTDWELLASTIGKTYREGGAYASADRNELLSAPADLALRVDFTTAANEEQTTAGVRVLSLRGGLLKVSEAVISNDVLSFDVGGDVVEFAAAQMPVGTSGEASASQISIGAVVDGYPLLRLVDRDQDDRVTLRERQEIPGLLAALDTNSDATVARHEIPVPLRFAITLGPHVHQLLADPTGSARSFAPRKASVKPPDWFTSMDKNNDRDVSQSEFLGTAEQFRQFDTDGDGLLSVTEALKLNTGQ